MVRRKFRNTVRRNKEAEKKRRTQIIISVIFVVLMIFSVMGIYVSNLQNQSLSNFNYGDYEFEVQEIAPGQTALITQVNGEDIPFYSLPQDTLTIPTKGNVSAVIGSTGYLVVAHNPTVETAQLIDLMRFDFDRYGQVLAISVPFTDNGSGVTCLNATAQIPIVTINQSTSTSINVDGSCVQIQATPTDLILIRDRLLFSMLGIMDR